MASSAESAAQFPVRNLQIALRALSEQHTELDALVPDGIYGPETTRTVTQFQRLFGLPETGDTDRDTWQRIHAEYFDLLRTRQKPLPLVVFPDPDTIIQKNDQGDLVYFIQLLLRKTAQRYENFSALEINGIFDAATEQEVLRFQAQALLPETGTVDRATWDRLARLYFTLL